MPSSDTQFKKGQSGNPGGRHSKLKWFYDKMDGRQDDLMEKAIQMALDGDQQMLTFILSRHAPAIPKDDPIEIGFEEKSAHAEKGNKVLQLLSEGSITPAQAYMVFASLAQQVKIVESQEVIDRISKLESALKIRK